MKIIKYRNIWKFNLLGIYFAQQLLARTYQRYRVLLQYQSSLQQHCRPQIHKQISPVGMVKQTLQLQYKKYKNNLLTQVSCTGNLNSDITWPAEITHRMVSLNAKRFPLGKNLTSSSQKKVLISLKFQRQMSLYRNIFDFSFVFQLFSRHYVCVRWKRCNICCS